MLLSDLIKKGEKTGESKAKQKTLAASSVTINAPASLSLTVPFDNNQIRAIIESIQSSRVAQLKEVANNAEYSKLLRSGELTADHLNQQPLLAEIILADDYIEKANNKVGVASLLAQAIKSATPETAHELVGIVMRSTFFNHVSPAVAIRLHTLFHQKIGTGKYLELYDSLLGSQTSMVAIPAMESLDDFSYIEKFAHLFQKLAQNRSSSTGSFHNSNYEESKTVLRSTMSKSIHEVALNLVRKAAEDPHRLPEVERVLDKFFSVLTHANIKLVSEVGEDVLVSKQLVIEYFFLLKCQASYSDKAIYFDLSSIKKLLELDFKSTSTVKLILQMAAKELLNSGKSRHELTLGYEYRLMPEETLRLIGSIGTDSSRDDKLSGFLGGYFAIKSKSIEAISHLEVCHKLPKQLAPEAFDVLAYYIVKNNPPKKLEGILKRLQATMKLEGLSEFGSALQNIVVPLMNQNFEKAWTTAYNMFILPGQRDIMTNLILEMLDDQHKAYHMKADLSYVPNLRLRES